MNVLVWFIIGYISGSLPFSVWLGKYVAHTDVRRIGDGNPGAANAWKAGGWRVGFSVLLLDYLKGALPVGVAHFVVGLSGWPLALIAIAPILGHACSLFLNFSGGKGLTVTFGVWSGLTLAQAPIILGLFMALFYFTLTADAWAVMFSLLGLLAHLLTTPSATDAGLLGAWLGNAAIVLWKHRHELRQWPRLKPLLARKHHA
jgi:glycerol-3-phosphate acyltransferase PlsY